MCVWQFHSHLGAVIKVACCLLPLVYFMTFFTITDLECTQCAECTTFFGWQVPDQWTTWGIQQRGRSGNSSSDWRFRFFCALSQIQSFNSSSGVSGDFGASPMYKMLGYFSIIGLLRLHSLLGDYHQALTIMKNIDVTKKVSKYDHWLWLQCVLILFLFLELCHVSRSRVSDHDVLLHRVFLPDDEEVGYFKFLLL